MFDKGKISYKSDLVLGETYKDKTTNLEGHLVSIHFYEHACERATLRYVNGMQEVVEATFDAPELVHVVTGVQATAEKTGGPQRSMGTRTVPSR